MPLFSFLRQSARRGASELVQSVSSISNFLPLINNSSKHFTLCGRNNFNQTSTLKIPLEKSIHPFFRRFVHAYPLTQAYSASNIHPSIRPFVSPSLPLLSIPLSIQPSMSPSVLHPSIRRSFFLSLSFCLSIPPFDPLLVRLSVSLSIPSSVWPIVLRSVCPSICPPASWCARLSLRPSVCPSIHQPMNLLRIFSDCPWSLTL